MAPNNGISEPVEHGPRIPVQVTEPSRNNMTQSACPFAPSLRCSSVTDRCG